MTDTPKDGAVTIAERVSHLISTLETNATAIEIANEDGEGKGRIMKITEQNILHKSDSLTSPTHSKFHAHHKNSHFSSIK